MKVRLISVTKPVAEELGTFSAEDLIAYCARVSNPNNQLNTETADELIRYLIKHKHWSPLQMVDATVEIETTRDIGRQILRHVSFSFQEFSQRYAEAQIFEVRDLRMQDAKNRQNSISSDDLQLAEWWQSAQQAVIALAETTYRTALASGLAKEVARAVLPEGLTMSRMYMKGSLRSWIHYLDVREGPETQKEHRLIAHAIAHAIVQVFPNVMAARKGVVKLQVETAYGTRECDELPSPLAKPYYVLLKGDE